MFKNMFCFLLLFCNPPGHSTAMSSIKKYDVFNKIEGYFKKKKKSEMFKNYIYVLLIIT